MSPEQVLGEEVDRRSDIFSLGVVLYEMATGQAPFRGNTAAGIIGSILTGSPVKPSALNSATPAKLERVILKALAKDRHARYQSAVHLASDIEEWQKSETAAQELRTRRWALALAGGGAAALGTAAWLTRWSLFPKRNRIRIAVLPFENVGSNPQDAVLVDGLHQDMISVLNRLYPDRLAVIARTSVRRYQAMGATIEQIGQDLKVAYVVEGGVQRDGGRARVSARLVRVKDQVPLWSATYNRDLGQVLAAQAEIAQAVGEGIEHGLRPDEQVSRALARPLNASAHEAYLRGDYARAIELDPGYGEAYARLANRSYYPGLFGFEPPRQAFTKMMNAASKALELDPTQASAHASRALSKLHLQWNWSEAEEGFRQALRLNPSDPETRHFYAHLLLWSGRPDESVRESDYALNVDPFDPGLISCLGFHYLQAGNEAKALEATLRGLALEPDHFFGLLTIGWIYEQKGMYAEALSALRKIAYDSVLKRASLAHAFARSGNRGAAGKILNDLLAESNSKYVSPCDIAIIYTALDDMDRAFEWLNRAYDERAGFLIFLNSDPRFKPLRRDPRYQQLSGRMGFPHRNA